MCSYSLKLYIQILSIVVLFLMKGSRSQRCIILSAVYLSKMNNAGVCYYHIRPTESHSSGWLARVQPSKQCTRLERLCGCWKQHSSPHTKTQIFCFPSGSPTKMWSAAWSCPGSLSVSCCEVTLLQRSGGRINVFKFSKLFHLIMSYYLLQLVSSNIHKTFVYMTLCLMISFVGW